MTTPHAAPCRRIRAGYKSGAELTSTTRALFSTWALPTTYAGGAKSLVDLEEVTRVGQGRIDLTIGSALDIFGGTGVRYEEVVAFNRRLAAERFKPPSPPLH